MKAETFHPIFPPLIDGPKPVWGQGNKLLSLQLLASIPMFTFEKEGTRKRAKMEEAYWEQKDKEYNQMKTIYDQNVFVGTIFKGNTDASAKITKIVIKEEIGYVCYMASDEHIQEVEKNNKKTTYKLKPVKAAKFPLISFISAIKSKTVIIVSTPKH